MNRKSKFGGSGRKAGRGKSQMSSDPFAKSPDDPIEPRKMGFSFSGRRSSESMLYLPRRWRWEVLRRNVYYQAFWPEARHHALALRNHSSSADTDSAGPQWTTDTRGSSELWAVRSIGFREFGTIPEDPKLAYDDLRESSPAEGYRVNLRDLVQVLVAELTAEERAAVGQAFVRSSHLDLPEKTRQVRRQISEAKEPPEPISDVPFATAAEIEEYKARELALYREENRNGIDLDRIPVRTDRDRRVEEEFERQYLLDPKNRDARRTSYVELQQELSGLLTSVTESYAFQNLPGLERMAPRNLVRISPAGRIGQIRRYVEQLHQELSEAEPLPVEEKRFPGAASIKKKLKIWDLREGWHAGRYHHGADRSLTEVSTHLKLAENRCSEVYEEAFGLIYGSQYTPREWRH